MARLIFPEIELLLQEMVIVFYIILAVTVIAVLRNVLGMVTYGVFGPAIISLGFTLIGDLYLGLVVFFIIFLCGLTVRYLLDPLTIQATHRLAIIVITVAVVTGILNFIGFTLGVVQLTYAGFLPILISSWIIERFVRHQKEDGLKTALKRFCFTMVAVLICYCLISQRAVTDLLINTPELWVLPITLNILFGTSVRIRLSELYRFRGLAESSGWSSVLTMNRRNQNVIESHNPMRLYSNTSKLNAKAIMQKAGIPTPETLAVFQKQQDLKGLEKVLDDPRMKRGFVIKPSNSYGGRGILIVRSRDGNEYRDSNGQILTLQEIHDHLTTVLDGEHSRGWEPDVAFIEELLTPHPALRRLAPAGLSDIRVIVFEAIPLMAMARLPTNKSQGKSNLHQGGIGAGFDLISGRITRAVIGNTRKGIRTHPDTGLELIGKEIPFWDEILRMAVRSQKASGFGYVGVDLTIDEEKGPLVMEVNKRPGLEIQNANHQPLLKRIVAVETFLKARSSSNERELSEEEAIQTMYTLEKENWNLQLTEEEN